MSGFLRIAFAYVAAVLIAAALTSAAATQIILQNLVALGVDMPLSVRLSATGRDLLGFAPILAALLAIGFLIALPVAALVSSALGRLRLFGFALAGAVAVIVMVKGIEIFYGIVLDATATPVAAARTLGGLLFMSLGGLVGGAVFALLKPARA